MSESVSSEDIVATFEQNDLLSPRDPESILCSPVRVGATLAMRCCGLLCLGNVPLLLAVELVQEFVVLSRKERRQYLQMAAKHGEQRKNVTKPVFVMRFVAGQKPFQLCAKAAALLFKCDHKTVYRAVKRAMAPARLDISVPRAPPLCSPEHIHMKSWLKQYIVQNGERDPVSDKIFMPVRLTYEALYNLYKEEADGDILKPLSQSSMVRILSLNWPTLKFPRLTGLGKCDRCFHLIEESKKQLDDAQKAMLKAELIDHRRTASDERDSYADRVRSSRVPGNRILSIAFDGASSVQLPHEYPAPRMITNSPRLEMLLYGTITHTWKRRRLYYSPPAFTHDVNYVLTVLSLEIACALRDNPRFDPTTLYLQADNCGSQNKNQYLFAFIAVLLFNGWFTDIHYNFLSVGHTHDDVDGMFGLFASQRKKTHRSAPTFPELIHAVTSGQKPLFKAEEFIHIGGVWDWRAYVQGMQVIQFLNLRDFKDCRSFHFRRTADGVRLRYRRTSNDAEPWIGGDFGPESVLVSEHPPIGQLTQFNPSAAMMEDMRTRGADLLKHLPQTYTVNQFQWFQSFTIEPCTQLTSAPLLCQELLRIRQHPEGLPPPAPYGHAPLPKIASPLNDKLSLLLYRDRYAQTGDIVAVKPRDGPELYYIACITEAPSRHDLVIQYYSESPNGDGVWQLTRETVRIKRSAILVSGFPFVNGRLPARSDALIKEALAMRAVHSGNK